MEFVELNKERGDSGKMGVTLAARLPYARCMYGTLLDTHLASPLAYGDLGSGTEWKDRVSCVQGIKIGEIKLDRLTLAPQAAWRWD